MTRIMKTINGIDDDFDCFDDDIDDFDDNIDENIDDIDDSNDNDDTCPSPATENYHCLLTRISTTSISC